MFRNKYLYNAAARCGALVFTLAASLAIAEVVRVDVSTRTDVLEGRSHGEAGVYEWLQGRAHFTLDPLNSRNDSVVDLKLAPRNAQGLVEFSADVSILRPKIAARANGVVIVDVVNRGRPTILEYLNRGNRAAAAGSEAFIGDDFLLRQGVTLVWLGWQQDLPPQVSNAPGTLRLAGPVVPGVSGRVYGEFSVASRVMDVSLGDRTSIPYAVADPQDAANTLAISPSRREQPRVIPREHWSFARLRDGKPIADPTRVQVEGGFVPGAIYQFAYGAKNPQVAGLGMAGVRDLAAWLRHDAAALVHATHVYAFGISQSGRFLRQFLYEGFNADTAGRQVFDGMMVHIAGGARRGFNERFAQPSRTTGSRVFPFTDIEQNDPETGESGGLLARATQAKVVPKILYTSSSWEYWGSGASTIHTTLAGGDMRIPDSSRVYLFAGTQHVPARLPLREVAARRGQLPHNPLDYRPALRALYVALDQWVRNGTEPPPSRHPTVAGRSLVHRTALNLAGLRGIHVPQGAQPVFRLDFGEKMPGVPGIVPPKVGKPHVVLLPQLDNDGNELPGIRMPALAVPLATHSGWNLRSPAIGAPHELVQLTGGMRAFARTREERTAGGDPRPSVTERYASREAYLQRVAYEANALVEQRLLLKEDLPQIAADAAALWDYVMQGGKTARP